jgi:hypothetical protein
MCGAEKRATDAGTALPAPLPLGVIGFKQNLLLTTLNGLFLLLPLGNGVTSVGNSRVPGNFPWRQTSPDLREGGGPRPGQGTLEQKTGLDVRCQKLGMRGCQGLLMPSLNLLIFDQENKNPQTGKNLELYGSNTL